MMRPWDYLALARRGQPRGLAAAASVLFTAAAVTALCFSGAILSTVSVEKAEPCELLITAPAGPAVTEQAVQDFRSLADVVDASGIVEVPVTAFCGKYTVPLTLVGIDGEYLSDLTYITGQPFPAGGAMPWITLSRAAARTFTDPEDETPRSADYMPDIDWLGTGFSLRLGGSTISAKVSGIFEGDEPAAYTGLDMAKALLQGQGEPSGYTGARVRVQNAGAAEAVSAAITDRGYAVANRDSARQERWDARTREAVYLAVLAAAGTVCAGSFRLAGAALHREQDRRRGDVLRWAGMGERAIWAMGVLRSLYLALMGAALGIAAHYLIAALVALGSASSPFAHTLSPSWLFPLWVCTGAVTAAPELKTRR